MRRDGDRLLFRSKGGDIAYAGDGKTYAIGFEVAVPGILVYLPNALVSLPEVDRHVILNELDTWLYDLGLVRKPAPALDEDEATETCLIARCGRRRLKGLYICRYHFEQSSGVEQTMHYVPVKYAGTV